MPKFLKRLTKMHIRPEREPESGLEKTHAPRRFRGQSFLELALILPILLIMLMGLVEVSLFIGRYLDILDLTREAARFASVRDPFVTVPIEDVSCSNPEPFHFYYHTACIFSPPASSSCTDPKFCNGLNSFLQLDPATDDVVISVYTTTKNPNSKYPSKTSGAAVTNIWPSPDGYWALSDHDPDTAHNENWKKDCEGNVVQTEPYYNEYKIEGELEATTNNGFVAIEFYYCYHQALNLPIINIFIPNPMRIHAYTVMPIPAAQPTATPKP